MNDNEEYIILELQAIILSKHVGEGSGEQFAENLQ